MNKKLIAAAIAAAMAAPVVAAADVTVYGKLHMSIDSVDEDAGYDGQALTDRDSRIGFKGSEDLGNGLKAVWKTEWTMDMDGENTGIANSRDNYLGVAGNFGTVLMAGNINSPYKKAFGKFDFFGDTLADFNNTIGMEDNRLDNALVYISPKFSGAQFSAATVMGEGTNGEDGIADGYALALTYNNAGIMASIAYENTDDLDTGDGQDSRFRVGLGYKMNAFKVAALYEAEDEGANNEDKRWQVSAAYTMGNNTAKAMYGSEDDDSANQDNSSWAIGLDHKMSKRTKVYALYVDSERGLRAPSEGNYGADSKGFSLGMVHSF